MFKALLIIDAETCEATSAARSCVTMIETSTSILDGYFDILVVGRSGGGAAGSGLACYGSRRVRVLEAEELDVNIPETFLESVAAIARDYDLVAAPADRMGLELMPRLAGALDVAYVSECSGVAPREGGLAFRRTLHAGNVIAWVCVESKIQLVTVRPNHFAPAQARTTASPVEICPRQAARMAAVGSIEIVEATELRSESAVLSEARIIVAGGVRLKGRFFQVLRPVAEALGATIGASRSACVAGFAPFDCQIGQTGKVVTPQLYLAVGISGSVQHMAGIRGAKWILAINKDPEAPIFRWANYGLVADMFEAVPALVECLNKQCAAVASKTT